MKARLTPRALAEAEREQTWWRENRVDAPELFDDELEEALEKIRRWPSRGTIYPSSFGTLVRRVLLTRTNNHVYYAVHDGEVVILCVWGAPRKRGPKL